MARTTGLIVASAATVSILAASGGPAVIAFQPVPTAASSSRCHHHDVTTPQPSNNGRVVLHGSSGNAGMDTYDTMLKQAYSAQNDARARKMGAVSTAEHELMQTTSALNAALDELKEIRDLIGPPATTAGTVAAPAAQQQQVQQQVQTQQVEEGQRLQLETTTGGALARPTPQQQQPQSQEQPLSPQPPQSSSHLGTPNKQSGMRGGSLISPLAPPTPGTNIDIDRLGPGSRYLTPSEARRISKTETTRMEASEAFGRGSMGYYGRRYGVYGSSYGYGPYAYGYGSYYAPYGGYGSYYSPYYSPYGYGHGYYDPFIYDYGYGNYYGDGRRNSLLWGSERYGPDFYSDQVEFAERQRDYDRARGSREYANRREIHERRLNPSASSSQDGAQQQQQGQPQQQQVQQQQAQQQLPQKSSSDEMLLSELNGNIDAVRNLQPNQQQPAGATSAATAGTTSSYLSSMPQQASATAAPAKKFSYLESAKKDEEASQLQLQQQHQQQEGQQQDAPYAEAEQMPMGDRRLYDRYGTSYSDARFNHSPYGGAWDYWGPYGRYGYGAYGGYGGVRGGDWFSEQIRRSERERVYDAAARSRWGGYYGGYYGGGGWYGGGWDRRSYGDWTFRPRDYV